MSMLISMKMSASWEAEKSSSNAVPRLCNISLAQIILDRPLELDCANTSFFVVVRMRGSARRVLRSPELTLTNLKTCSQVNGLAPPSPVGAISSSISAEGASIISPGNTVTSTTGSGGCVPIDFNCSIQYSHILNRDVNTLQILLQRRKKYKSKTMNFGYKTLAYCNVDLAHVLQRRIENRFLELYTDPNCTSHPVGRVEVQSLSTTPLEKESNGKRKVVDEDEDYPMPEVYSEDSDHVEESDDDATVENEDVGHSRQKKLVKAMSIGQKQLKQKVINLLKKLKIGDPNEEDLDTAENSKLWDEIDLMATVSDIEEEDSDVDAADSLSIRSTPKPMLRPFFATTGGSDETMGADAGTKLLTRLHKQLFVQGETDSTEVAHVQSQNVQFLDASTKPVNPSSPKETKKDTAPMSSSFSLTAHSRTVPSVLRHHRGVNLSGGRLAKRFARMGRRSTVTSSGKRVTAAVDPLKSSETSIVIERPVPECVLTDKPSGSSLRLGTDSQSGYESSDGDSVPRERAHLPTTVCRGNLDANSAALCGDSQVSGSRLGTIVHTRPEVDQPSPPASPTSASTPDAHRTRPLVSGYPSRPINELLATASLEASNELMQLRLDSLDKLANVVFLVSLLEPGGKVVADVFGARNIRLTLVTSYMEIKQLFSRLVTETQSQNLRSSDGALIKVCILGGDILISFVLRAYVDQLSSRSAELAASFRFYVIPISSLVQPKLCPTSGSLSDGNSSPTRQIQSTPHKVDGTVRPTDVPALKDIWTDVEFAYPSTYTHTNNTVCLHLCKLDPVYAALFQELILENPLNVDTNGSSTAPNDSSDAKRSSWNLFERTLIYITNSRNLLNMPIGACLLGTTSSSSLLSKTHKSDVVSSYPTPGSAPAQTETVGGSTPDAQTLATTKHGTSGGVGMNEEVLVPFLLSVRLGFDPYTSFPLHTHPTHLRSGTGDPVLANVSTANVFDFASVPSDAETTIAQTKRNTSPEVQVSLTSSRSSSHRKRFRRAYSTFHSSVQNPIHSIDYQLWDLQLEYWVLPPSTIPVSANTGLPATPVVSTSSGPLSSPLTFPSPSSGATDPVSSRRVTMKSICRGLLVTLGPALLQPPSRAGEGNIHSSEFTTSTASVRLPPMVYAPVTSVHPQMLSLAVWTKEKKQKIMRIGRRGKDCGCKLELIDGIQRLLCTGRGSMGNGPGSSSVERHRDSETTGVVSSTVDASGLALEYLTKGPGTTPSQNLSPHNPQIASSGSHAMKTFIDGVEWIDLKFFQITPIWRTHIKSFPVSALSVGRVDPHQSEPIASPSGV